jgi:hypothetical protein
LEVSLAVSLQAADSNKNSQCKNREGQGTTKISKPHLMSVGSHWNAEGPSKAKVCQLQLVQLPVNEQVLGLKVSM